MERWWRGRVTGADAVTKATAARDCACLRSALSRAVEWKLIETNPLMGMRHRSAASRKVVRFLSPDEEAMLRAALASRDRRANANASRRRYRQAVLPDLPMNGYVDHLTPVVLTAINTGMKRGVLLSMTWADINWEAKMLTIPVFQRTYIDKGLLAKEASLLHTRWAGSRYMSPVHATQAFTDAYIAAYRAAWGRHFDPAQAPHKQPCKSS